VGTQKAINFKARMANHVCSETLCKPIREQSSSGQSKGQQQDVKTTALKAIEKKVNLSEFIQ